MTIDHLARPLRGVVFANRRGYGLRLLPGMWGYRKVPLADPGGIHFYNNGVREAMSGSIRPFLRNGLNTGELSPSGA